MRIAVITLSVIILLVMVDHGVISLRIGILINSDVRPHEALSSLVLFCIWAVATALVYPFPTAAIWLFALAGAYGLHDGLNYGNEELTLWGSIALGLAALAALARREKLSVDRLGLAREQHYRAVHAALRSLQESAPQLLSHGSDIEPGEQRELGPLVSTVVPSQRRAVRRA